MNIQCSITDTTMVSTRLQVVPILYQKIKMYKVNPSGTYKPRTKRMEYTDNQMRIKVAQAAIEN